VIGDCGSWVIDRMTGEIYGHVIAGDGEIEYVVPATQIIRDVESALGTAFSLPDEETPISADSGIPTAISPPIQSPSRTETAEKAGDDVGLRPSEGTLTVPETSHSKSAVTKPTIPVSTSGDGGGDDGDIQPVSRSTISRIQCS
jgi:hypothetical protein